MGWTANKAERARRRAICDKCETWRVRVKGKCERCRRPLDTHFKDDEEFAAGMRCECGGEIHATTMYERCGTGEKLPNGQKLGCGCPLGTRVFAYCPKGKW